MYEELCYDLIDGRSDVQCIQSLILKNNSIFTINVTRLIIVGYAIIQNSSTIQLEEGQIIDFYFDCVHFSGNLNVIVLEPITNSGYNITLMYYYCRESEFDQVTVSTIDQQSLSCGADATPIYGETSLSVVIVTPKDCSSSSEKLIWPIIVGTLCGALLLVCFTIAIVVILVILCGIGKEKRHMEL